MVGGCQVNQPLLLPVTESLNGPSVFVLVTDEQFNVTGSHRLAMELHALLRIFWRHESNIGFASRPSVAAVGEHNTIWDGIVSIKELENVVLGG
jgi:hypothetical protein